MEDRQRRAAVAGRGEVRDPDLSGPGRAHVRVGVLVIDVHFPNVRILMKDCRFHRHFFKNTQKFKKFLLFYVENNFGSVRSLMELGFPEFKKIRVFRSPRSSIEGKLGIGANRGFL